MVAKLFTAPFAKDGDKTPIPNQLQLDGSVSYEAGFGADYERQLGVDPAAKNIRRQSFNELQFDITTALQELQSGAGVSVFNLGLAQSLPGGGYPKGAVIPRVDGLGLWVNNTVANTSNPDTGGAGWSSVFTDGSNFAVDTGIVNAYVGAFSPAIVARSPSRFLSFKVKVSNTGAATFNDGLGAAPLLGASQQPLQGGELVANGLALVFWNATLNSYVLAFSSGGALPVLAGKSTLHAVNVLQVQSQLVTAFATTGTATAQVLTPAPAIAAYTTSQRFSVTFNIASGANPTINVSGRGVKSLKQYNYTGAKVAATFVAGQISDIVYDGVDFVMLAPLPPLLDYVPVQQGGGVGMTTNKVYVGWNGARLIAQVDAQQLGEFVFSAAGDVVVTAGNTAPPGTLKMDGSAVSRTGYAALFARIGVLYGVGDGSTSFNVPDARGEFVRGWDDGRGVNPGRLLGSLEGFATQDHTHSSAAAPVNASYLLNNGVTGSTAPGTSTGSMNTGVAANETRPRNIAFLFCIRY